MNMRRIGVLFTKEIRQGAKNFFFIYAIIMPVILSLIVTLAFGDIFSATPRLGIYDAGDSAMTGILSAEQQIETTRYSSESALRDAVERGSVTVGLSLPADFDAALSNDAQSQMTILVWSEGVASNITVINSAIDEAQAQMTGAESPVIIEAISPGDAQTTSWTERLLPMIVLMTIILGGVLIPSSSLVDEKQKRTLNALTITPASLMEVYSAKALAGILVSIIMGLIVLVLNSAFGGQPLLLVLVLGMGAVASSVFGVLLGSLVKDINMLLAVIKAGGLVLFAPALIQLVPSVPQWMAQVFPTYYMMNPVLEVSQNGAGLGDIIGELSVLLAVIGVMVVALVVVIERQQKQLALAG
ncbi:MAG: ABC transporter permease [Aggregatilineales bacterium]